MSKSTKRLVFRSIFNFPIGYAVTGREIAKALQGAGLDVVYEYAYGPGTVFPVNEPPDFSEPLLMEMASRNSSVDDPAVVYAQADVFQFAKGSPRIGFTMFEADGLPVEWVRQCNLMDEVWVPSSFNQDTFRKAGVSVPIRIIPLGIDPNVYCPEGERHRREDIFSFVSVFEWGPRKAPEILLKAFNEEFNSSEPVGLFCKVSSDNHESVRNAVERMRLNDQGGKIFLSINSRFEDKDLAALYRSMDCFVLPTHGEGWGMPYLEASACGLPVIATNWSAPLDFLTEDSAYLVDVESMVMCEHYSPYYHGLRWASPSYEHLKALMRKAFENRAMNRAKLLLRSEEIRRQFTWDQTAARIIQNLDRLCS